MKRVAPIAWLAVPGAALLVAIYAWPMLRLFRMAFNETGGTGAMVETWSLATWAKLAADSFTLDVTWFR